MDLREKRTQRNIRNAFIQLRGKKELSKITVKELAETAEISKATFYLHYRDIYDLSEKMQKEVIRGVFEGISQPELFFHNKAQFLEEFVHAFYANKPLIDILFGDQQRGILPVSIEHELKEYLIGQHPELKEDADFNTKFTFLVMGSFYAFWENSATFSSEEVLRVVKSLLEKTYPAGMDEGGENDGYIV